MRTDWKKKYEYPEDVMAIRNAINHMGFDVSLDESFQLWEKYSDSMAAGWMNVPNNPVEIFRCVEFYILDLENYGSL